MEFTSMSLLELQPVLSQISSISFNAHAICGALIIWIFSWLWHDFIVVKPWLRWTGMSLEEAQALHKGKLVQDLGLYLASKLALAYACMLLALVLKVQNVTQALLLSLVISAGVVLPAGVGPVIFEKRHAGLWVLSSSLTSMSVLVVLMVQLI
jgi:hypothetical protein